jgi:hypothetical protein
MKEIFQKLALKGYSIYNKRVLGNPLYTSEETRLRDITQEIALVVEWLRVNHNIHVTYDCNYNWELKEYRDKAKFYYVINFDLLNSLNENLEPEFLFNTPQEAYSEAITYCLEKII